MGGRGRSGRLAVGSLGVTGLSVALDVAVSVDGLESRSLAQPNWTLRPKPMPTARTQSFVTLMGLWYRGWRTDWLSYRLLRRAIAPSRSEPSDASHDATLAGCNLSD